MNVISAPCILKEKLTKLDLVATVLVFGGVLIAILFASREVRCSGLRTRLLLYFGSLECGCETPQPPRTNSRVLGLLPGFHNDKARHGWLLDPPLDDSIRF